jgi:hypothetical protein
LKPGGQLYIHDVIFEQVNAMENIKAFVDKQSVAGGDFLKNDAEGHFQQEHSTSRRPSFSRKIQDREQNYSRGRHRKITLS